MTHIVGLVYAVVGYRNKRHVSINAGRLSTRAVTTISK